MKNLLLINFKKIYLRMKILKNSLLKYFISIMQTFYVKIMNVKKNY